MPVSVALHACLLWLCVQAVVLMQGKATLSLMPKAPCGKRISDGVAFCGTILFCLFCFAFLNDFGNLHGMLLLCSFSFCFCFLSLPHTRPSLMWKKHSSDVVAFWIIGAIFFCFFFCFSWIILETFMVCFCSFCFCFCFLSLPHTRPSLMWKKDSSDVVAFWIIGAIFFCFFFCFSWIILETFMVCFCSFCFCFCFLSLPHTRPSLMWKKDSSDVVAFWLICAIFFCFFFCFSWIILETFMVCFCSFCFCFCFLSLPCTRPSLMQKKTLATMSPLLEYFSNLPLHALCN